MEALDRGLTLASTGQATITLSKFVQMNWYLLKLLSPEILTSKEVRMNRTYYINGGRESN